MVNLQRGAHLFWKIVLMTLIACSAAKADWLNLTGAETAPNIAEISVTDEGVYVALEISLADLHLFDDILPDEMFREKDSKRLQMDARLTRFAHDALRVETNTGQVLPVRVEKLEPRLRKDRKSLFSGMFDPQTKRRIPDPPVDKRVIYAELFYAFTSRPESLLLSPPRDASGQATVTIGFIAFHNKVPIIDFRYLSGSAELLLDWDDPWYSKFKNPNLSRHHKDALMMFLYVEPRQIRQEALLRVRDLAEWTNPGQDRSGVIGVKEQAALLKRAAEFYGSKNPLRADGKALSATSVHAQFIEIGIGGVKVLENPGPLERGTALLGLISTYNIDALPDNVSVDWELFTQRQKQVPATLIDPAGPLLNFITSDDRHVKWQNSLKVYREPAAFEIKTRDRYTYCVPYISLVLIILTLITAWISWTSNHRKRKTFAGIAIGLLVASGAFLNSRFHTDIANPLANAPGKKHGAEIVQKLLENLHVAILEHDPTRRGNVLETSVATKGKADIEREIDTSLAVRLAGGGNARAYQISDVALQDTSSLGAPGALRATATWKTLATGGHWGHAHRQEITYQGVVDLAPIGGKWKLTGLTVTQAK